MSAILACKRDLWSPYALPRSVLKAWWAPEDLTPGSVATWTDRIGGLAITAAGGAQPVASATSQVGADAATYPGVTFDGVDDCLVTTTLTSLPTDGTAGALFSVLTIVSSITNSVFVNYGTGVATSRRINQVGSSKLSVNDASTSLTQTTGVNTIQVASGNWSGTTMNGYVNGTALPGSPATIASLNTGTTRLRFGANIAGTAAAFSNVCLSDVLILQNVLSTENRQRMEGFLAWKYGSQSLLPSTHPYQRFRP